MRTRLPRFVLAAVALGFVVSCLALIGRASAATSAFSYDTKVNYRVIDNTTTRVEEVYTVTNQTARQYLTELKITTPSDKITDLEVTYSDGTDIPTTVASKPAANSALSVATQEITIKFPRVTAGSGQRWQFVVSYQTTGLVETKGSSHTVYVPAIADNEQRGSYSVLVDVPQYFGTPHFADAQGHLVLKDAQRQTYAFSGKEVADRSLALVFGDSTIYNMTFNAPLTNNSPVPRNFTVTLPPDLSTQTTLIKKLNPAPKTTRLDADGNVLAEYTVGPYQQLTVVANLEGQARYRDYNMSNSGTKKDLPADVVAAYTKPTRYWQTDGAVAAAAKSVVKSDAKVSDNVRAVYDYVINKLTYNNDKIKFNVRQGAAKALANPSNAICLEYADLMIAMLRSQGIPARMVVGYAYAGSIKTSAAVADSLHSWVEAYVPGVGWMTVDPTWGEKFDDFGRSDLDHYAFTVWGKNDSAPAAVMQGNTDTGYQYENTQLSFSDASTSVAPSGSVQVRRYAIAPFIAVDKVSITGQSQIVSTQNTLVIGEQKSSLGSLAPGQKLNFLEPAIGSTWNQPVAVELQRQTGGRALVVAKSISTVSYLPMIVIGLLLIALWLLFVLRLRTKHRSSRVKKIFTDYNNKRDVLGE